MNYLFSERQNFTVLHVPSLSKTKICDICGSYECALKGVNSFCSKNLIDLSPSLLPSSATRAFLSYHKCCVSIINLLITFLCYLIHKWNINLSWYIYSDIRYTRCDAKYISLLLVSVNYLVKLSNTRKWFRIETIVLQFKYTLPWSVITYIILCKILFLLFLKWWFV